MASPTDLTVRQETGRTTAMVPEEISGQSHFVAGIMKQRESRETPSRNSQREGVSCLTQREDTSILRGMTQTMLSPLTQAEADNLACIIGSGLDKYTKIYKRSIDAAMWSELANLRGAAIDQAIHTWRNGNPA